MGAPAALGGVNSLCRLEEWASSEVDARVICTPLLKQGAVIETTSTGAGGVVDGLDVEHGDDAADPAHPAARAGSDHLVRVVDLADLGRPHRPAAGLGEPGPRVLDRELAGGRQPQRTVEEGHRPIVPDGGPLEPSPSLSRTAAPG